MGGSKSSSSTSSKTEQTDKRIQTGDGGVVLQLEQGSSFEVLDPNAFAAGSELAHDSLDFLENVGGALLEQTMGLAHTSQELVGSSQKLVTEFVENQNKKSSERTSDKLIQMGIPAAVALGIAYMVVKK